jgi:hypothetical protein
VSEIQHPEIVLDSVNIFSPEEEFAKLAQEVLGRYGVMCDDTERGISYPVTDRLEISDDDEPNERALRLRRTQVLALNTADTLGSVATADIWMADNSEDYIVIELQHGSVSKDEVDPEEPLVDEDYQWMPYVMAVVQTDDPYEISILDASTGKDLNAYDVMKATDALRHLGDWLYSELFEDGIANDQSIAIRVHPQRHQNVAGLSEFSAEEADLNYSCVECGEDNGVCSHNIPKLN